MHATNEQLTDDGHHGLASVTLAVTRNHRHINYEDTAVRCGHPVCRGQCYVSYVLELDLFTYSRKLGPSCFRKGVSSR